MNDSSLPQAAAPPGDPGRCWDGPDQLRGCFSWKSSWQELHALPSSHCTFMHRSEKQRLALGSQVVSNAIVVAGIGAGSAIAVPGGEYRIDGGSFTALLLLSVPFAELGRLVDRYVRKVNGRIAHLTAEAVDRGDLRAVEHGLFAGLTLFALSGVLLALAFSGAGVAVAKFLLPRFGPGSRLEFSALLPVLPLLGAASVYSCSRTERTAAPFFLTMAAVFAATVLFRWAP